MFIRTRSRFVSALTPASAAAALMLAATLGFFGPSSVSASSAAADQYSNLPGSLTLSGIVRDFQEKSVARGHADFERDPTRGFAHYVNEVADDLDSNGKPVFLSTGNKVTTQAKDAQGRNIMPVTKSYIQARTGDVRGAVETQAGGSLTTSAAFAQWYTDTANVNSSAVVPITLVRQPNSNTYTFDDKTDSGYSAKGGFFPINGQLYGNSSGGSKNFHFTYELTTKFNYKKNSGQVFTFTGDDDVFVFIGGKLVIDLGGVHSAISQTIDLDRLTHLTDGNEYELKLFFAERHRTQSNMRIDTTLTLKSAELPAVSALAD